ncbi:MAG: hypothetical protein ACRDK2_04580 [Solirubrobacteraceae bacterium]
MSEDAPQRPLSELNLFDGYLQPRARQFARAGQPLWIINDCFDGEITGALKCTRWASKQAGGTVRTLNLAGDEQTMQALEAELAANQSISVNLLGCMEQASERLLETIGSSPALVMLDPLQGAGTRVETLARLNTRRMAKTELLLTLTAASLRRLISDGAPEHIDRVVGSSLWRRLSRQEDDLSNLTRISVLYRACLQRGGYTYARKIVLREPGDRPGRSQLVFVTHSRTALSLMSDLACAYLSGDQDTLAPSELAERVCRLGAQLQSANSGQIIGGLACELFGRFTSGQCRQVIADLARRGTIHVPDPDCISDGQTLMFGATSQMALFDTDPPS